MIVNIPKCMMP